MSRKSQKEHQIVDFVDIFDDTVPGGEEVSGLPKISPVRLAYVKLIWSGLSQTEAYRQAYQSTSSPHVLGAAASRLSAHPDIRAWLDYGRSAIANSVVCTKESHLAELARLSASAELAGQYAAAVNAEISRGRAAGLYIERTEIVDMTPQQIIDEVRRLLGDEAAVIAEELLH